MEGEVRSEVGVRGDTKIEEGGKTYILFFSFFFLFDYDESKS